MHSSLSRRAADTAIEEGRVQVNGRLPDKGYRVLADDSVTLDGARLAQTERALQSLILNKPVGYVCSRNGQGNRTIYELLPPAYHHLNPVGRLDKNSSGLLLLTNDGSLQQELTHPRYQKVKIYEVILAEPLAPLHQQMISDIGITLEDGNSRLALEKLNDDRRVWRVTMREGRNRQIRRTFAALGYSVKDLHRTNFGDYRLAGITLGQYREVPSAI